MNKFALQGREAALALHRTGALAADGYPVLSRPDGFAVALSGTWQARAWRAGFDAARLEVLA